MWDGSLHPVRVMQSVRDVLRQSYGKYRVAARRQDAVRAGCAEAKAGANGDGDQRRDAIRAGCAEAKSFRLLCRCDALDAIRAGCSETNGRSLYSNDHAQNNEVNRKES